MAGVLPDKELDGSPTSRKPRKTSVSYADLKLQKIKVRSFKVYNLKTTIYDLIFTVWTVFFSGAGMSSLR